MKRYHIKKIKLLQYELIDDGRTYEKIINLSNIIM